jgi:hypothetical protein
MHEIDLRRVVVENEGHLGRILQAACTGGASDGALRTLACLTSVVTGFPGGAMPSEIPWQHLEELKRLALIRVNPEGTLITLI